MFHPADRVLVAVMNDPRDFALARDEGWYRIPQRRAPGSITEAAAVAFYFTKAFGEDKWAIHWYGPVRGYELARRRDLLPDESEHPRADDAYYKLQLGPLMRLEQPIPSLRWRRISFIETSWDRFSAAEEINDLYASGADGMYVTLKDYGLFPERELIISEGGVDYVADLAIPCQDGTLAISVTECTPPPGALHNPDVEVVERVVSDLGGPLRPTALRLAS